MKLYTAEVFLHIQEILEFSLSPVVCSAGWSAHTDPSQFGGDEENHQCVRWATLSLTFHLLLLSVCIGSSCLVVTCYRSLTGTSSGEEKYKTKQKKKKNPIALIAALELRHTTATSITIAINHDQLFDSCLIFHHDSINYSLIVIATINIKLTITKIKGLSNN